MFDIILKLCKEKLFQKQNLMIKLTLSFFSLVLIFFITTTAYVVTKNDHYPPPTVKPSTETETERRDIDLARVVQEYSNQGDQVTSSVVDNQSGKWLAEKLKSLGYLPEMQSWTFNNQTKDESFVKVGFRTIEGFPLYNSQSTGDTPITGVLGISNGPIWLVTMKSDVHHFMGDRTGIDAAIAAGAKAIVAITDADETGLALPVIQAGVTYAIPIVLVGSENKAELEAAAATQAKVVIISQIQNAKASAMNIVAKHTGSDPSLSPLLVVTPRSAWMAAAAERGSGIATWLSVAAAVKSKGTKRDIRFAAFSGHEWDFIGFKNFVADNPAIVNNVYMWVQIGANVGAAPAPDLMVQSSSPALELMVKSRLASLPKRTSLGHITYKVHSDPSEITGASRVVHELGGQFYGLVGLSNPCFHLPCDIAPQRISESALVGFTDFVTELTFELADSPSASTSPPSIK